MPVVSTLVNVSLSLAQKKGIKEDGRLCRCRCGCHQAQQQQHTPLHAEWGQSIRDDVSSWTQAASQRQGPLFGDMKRAPFRAFNGKAYSVPHRMINQFNAALQYAQNGVIPHDWSTSYFPLQSPGVLWRHDPYSTQVLDVSSNSSAYHLSTVAEQDDFTEFEGSREEEEETVQKKTTNITKETIYTPAAYNYASWNPMCPLQPSSASLSAASYFPTTDRASSSCVYSNFVRPPYTDAALTQTNQRDSCIATADTASDTAGQRQDHQNSLLPVVPSARPFPFATGRCVVVRSVPPPPPPPPSLLPAANCSSTTASASNATTVTSARVGSVDEGEMAGFQDNSLLRHAQRSRCSRGRGDCRAVDEFSAARLATLSAFRSLPPLFTDLAAHTNRRLSTMGRTSDDDTRTRADEVIYVYLVGHRCRRTVCAASVLHEVGTMVVLEGDMGIEMGTVGAVLSLEEFDQLDTVELARHGFPTDHDIVTAALILRPATMEETTHYTQTLCHFAKDLLSFLQHRLNPSNFLDCHVENMEFLDCEFQADGKKIYVYYRAKKRVLFRELAQYLHSFYRCRIWLHEVGKGASTVSGDSSQDTELP